MASTWRSFVSSASTSVSTSRPLAVVSLASLRTGVHQGGVVVSHIASLTGLPVATISPSFKPRSNRPRNRESSPSSSSSSSSASSLLTLSSSGIREVERSCGYQYLLCVEEEKAQFFVKEAGAVSSPIECDFIKGEGPTRVGVGSLDKNTPLIRACTLPNKKLSSTVVFDATAGFGTDSFCLAHHGARVIATERVSVLCLLLNQGIQKALLADAKSAVSRIRVLHGDSRDILRDCSSSPRFQSVWSSFSSVMSLPSKPIGWPSSSPSSLLFPCLESSSYFHQDSSVGANNSPIDVVYVDPLFPPRTSARLSSAHSNKYIEFIKAVSDNRDELDTLIEAARHCGARRVVVKRRASDESTPGADLRKIDSITAFDVINLIG